MLHGTVFSTAALPLSLCEKPGVRPLWRSGPDFRIPSNSNSSPQFPPVRGTQNASKLLNPLLLPLPVPQFPKFL